MYEKGSIIVAQGSSRIYLDNQTYDDNPDNYLVMALPIAAECEIHASESEPLLCIMVDIDMENLNTVIGKMHSRFDHDRFGQEGEARNSEAALAGKRGRLLFILRRQGRHGKTPVFILSLKR